VRVFVDEKKPALVMIDPVKNAHAVEENNNDDMDAVVTILATLAIEKNIAVDVLSHERKSSQPAAGDVNRARGAGALKDGGRLMYTNTWMTEDEANTFGVSKEERRFLFRVDPAKVNLAPPSASAQWFKLVGVKLDNGDATYPNGDEVQTVEPWTPPALFNCRSQQGARSAARGNGRRQALLGCAIRERKSGVARVAGNLPRARRRALPQGHRDLGQERGADRGQILRREGAERE
jgi:hypothetical protein